MQEEQLILNQNKKRQTSSRDSKKNLQELPQIPDKVYFTIGEVSNLCLVKPHVLRYWEQEFVQLSPTKRRGMRRYYQRTEIILIRQIKTLLYEQGFTIEGARTKLRESDKADTKTGTKSDKLIKDAISKLTGMLEDL